MNNEEMRDEAVVPEETEDVRALEATGEADAQAKIEVSTGKEVPETEMAEVETGEENDSGDLGKSQEEPEKEGFFGEKKDRKDPRDAQIEELTDRVHRTMAEFNNHKKRTEREKSAMYEVGAKDIVERTLPVVDNFERGLTAILEDAKGSPFTEGVEMIYKQLLKALEEAGVKPIEAVGQESDLNFHNAVIRIKDENLGENVVAQELQRGYMYRDPVVGYSMVQVVNQLGTGNWKLTNIRR